jgi:hypothetical protein
MKNKLLTFAGALAVMAVLGHFYAKPLLAQVRAALVEDVDQPARNFVQVLQTPIAVPAFTTTGVIVSAPFYVVPANKRLTVDTLTIFNFFGTNAVPVEADVDVTSGSACTGGVVGGSSRAAILSVTDHGTDAAGQPHIWGSASLPFYADQGQCLFVELQLDSRVAAGQGYFLSMSGHLVSLP